MKKAKTRDALRLAAQDRGRSGGAAAPESGPGVRLSIFLVVAATLLVYSNTFHASFHFDDVTSIVENRAVHDLRNFWPPSGGRWLGSLSFALNFRVGRLDPTGYHAVNLLIHVANALLVHSIARLLLASPALGRVGPLVGGYLPLTAALLFGVHPLATQAVTYVAQRFTSLATLFFLASLSLYLLARLRADSGAHGVAVAAPFVGAVLSALAAMKTKEIAFTLPVAAAGCELLLLRRRRPLWLLPLALAAVLVPLDRLAEARQVGDMRLAAAEAPGITRSDYLLTQTRVVATYLRMIVLPAGQNLDHDVSLSTSIGDWKVLLSTAALVALAAIASAAWRRARAKGGGVGTLVFAGVAWFFVTVSVESSVIPIRDLMNEHRAYLPSVGAMVALAAALLSALERLGAGLERTRAIVAIALVAVPLAVAAHVRNRVWRDEESLWRDVVAKSPGKGRGYVNLGAALSDRGALDEAIEVLERAVALSPAQPEAHKNLGRVYRAKGFLDRAERAYRTAVRLDPSRAPYSDLGAVLTDQGRHPEAIEVLNRAVALAPEDGTARCNLGMAQWGAGDLPAAEQDFRRAIALAPDLAEAHANLGAVLVAMGRPAEAVPAHERALALRSRPEFTYNLAVALEAAGRTAEAAVQYERFLSGAGTKYPGRAERARAKLTLLRSGARP